MFGPDSSYYGRIVNWSSSEKYRGELGALLAALALPSGSRVLDLGCGPGAAMRFFREAGLRRIGFDRGTSWIEFCAERPVLRADAAALPFRDASFDAVILMHVLAHLEDPAGSLGEIARVLRPGGKIGVVTPNLLHLRVLRLLPWKRFFYVPDPTVERHYDARGLTRLLDASSFRMTRLARIGASPFGFRAESFRERIVAVAEKGVEI